MQHKKAGILSDITYWKDEIVVHLLYLPNFRASLPLQRPSDETMRATAGGKPVSPSFVPSYLGLKNRSDWLPGQDSNL